MDNQQIRETLEKQLQLLSERSHESDLPVPFICDLTQVMEEKRNGNPELAEKIVNMIAKILGEREGVTFKCKAVRKEDPAA